MIIILVEIPCEWITGGYVSSQTRMLRSRFDASLLVKFWYGENVITGYENNVWLDACRLTEFSLSFFQYQVSKFGLVEFF